MVFVANTHPALGIEDGHIDHPVKTRIERAVGGLDLSGHDDTFEGAERDLFTGERLLVHARHDGFTLRQPQA